VGAGGQGGYSDEPRRLSSSPGQPPRVRRAGAPVVCWSQRHQPVQGEDRIAGGHDRLVDWAARVVAGLFLKSAPPPDVRDHGLSDGLNAAIADLSSLQQAQVPFGNRKVLAILGFDGAPASSVPGLAAALPGVTVVVTGFPAKPRAQHTWIESIKHQGAATVVVLTKSTTGELTSVVSRGLAGTATQPTLTRS